MTDRVASSGNFSVSGLVNARQIMSFQTVQEGLRAYHGPTTLLRVKIMNFHDLLFVIKSIIYNVFAIFNIFLNFEPFDKDVALFLMPMETTK